jgi:hypothetical protein
MKSKKTILLFFAAILLTSGVSACTPAQTTPVPAAAAESDNTRGNNSAPTPVILLTATPIPGLLPVDVFSTGSTFCLPEVEGSSFESECSQNNLVITQASERRKVDAILMREQSVDAQQFNLEADITSQAGEDVKTDQNAYGFYYLDEFGSYKAVRIRGQYFSFETWHMTAEPEVEDSLNPAFSPFIKSAGQENQWRLACTRQTCDLYVNDSLIGRSNTDLDGAVQSAGIFTASAWDEEFGEVTFSKLWVSDRDAAMPQFEPYSLQADLKSEQELFAQTGMSGAFKSYQEDGLHFSPVIPFGYYGAKTGPALENMDISATIKMEIDPEKPGSQYAGLICRSGLDGMYLAVIGVDGTYTIYRDTPQKPFSLLAENTSTAILTGKEENKLRLVCEGDTISFYINDQQVETLTDTRYRLNYGRAGIYTKAGSEPDEDAIIFSDLSIRETNLVDIVNNNNTN